MMIKVTDVKSTPDVAPSANGTPKDKDLSEICWDQYCDVGKYRNAIEDAFDAGFNAGLLRAKNEMVESSFEPAGFTASASSVDPFMDPRVSISDLWNAPLTPNDPIILLNSLHAARIAVAEASVKSETIPTSIPDACPAISSSSDASLLAANETSSSTPDNEIESSSSITGSFNSISSDIDPTSAWNTNSPNQPSYDAFGLSSNYDSSGSHDSSTGVADS